MRVRTRPPRGTSRPPRGPHAHSPHSRDDPERPQTRQCCRKLRARLAKTLCRGQLPQVGWFLFCSHAANSIRLTFWKVFSRNCGRGADLKNADTSPDFPGFSRIFGACDFLWGPVFLQGEHKKVAFSEKNTLFAQNTLSRPLVESFLRQTARAPPNAPGPCAYVRWAVIWRVRKKPSHMSHAQHGD